MKHFIVLLLSLAMSICIQAQFQPQKNQIDSLLKSIYNDTLPGVSMEIIKDGSVIFNKSYGVADISSRQKLTALSNFNIASLTKQFTAMAILQLEEQHKLSLSDAISKYFPDMNKHVADMVTIRNMLTHSSGIIDHYEYADTKGVTHAHDIDVYNAIKNIDSLYFKPGNHFRYSNTAYCLLALIIEKVTGMPYHLYMKEKIFNAAGMMRTNVWNEKTTIPQMVTGYEFDSASNRYKVSGPGEHIFFSTEGDGGICTSVTDYAKWFTALQSGKIFSKAIVEKARSLQFIIDKEKSLGYGFGWFIDDNDGTKKVYHSGSNSGFRSFSFTIPASNYLVILFSNRDDIDLETLVQKIAALQWPSLSFTRIEALTS